MRKLKKHSCCEKCVSLAGNGVVFGGNCSEVEKIGDGFGESYFCSEK